MNRDQENLNAYPDIMTKEQMRIVCHISKRKATYLLQNGLVPCVNTGKKTHTYLIRKSDIQVYLQNRMVRPETYDPCSAKPNVHLQLSDRVSSDQMQRFYTTLTAHYPNLMTVAQVSELTGYSGHAVQNWIRNGHLRCFDCIGGWRIPKVWLIDFLCSHYCNGIARKSLRHLSYLAQLLQELQNDP